LAVVKLDKDGNPVGGGAEEKGMAYNFSGGLTEMSHKGVQWLTMYDDLQNEHVVRMKTARLGLNKNLIVYEKWTLSRYVSSHMQIIDDTGASLTGEIKSAWDFKLPPTNDMKVVDGKAIVYSATAPSSGSNELMVIEFAF
jgi:hypothetical protein